MHEFFSDIGSTVDSLLSKISEESSPVKRRVRHLNALAKVRVVNYNNYYHFNSGIITSL